MPVGFVADAPTKSPIGFVPDAQSDNPSSNLSLGMKAAGAAVPIIQQGAEVVATSPTIAKTMGTVARVGTTVAGIAHGAATGNIPEIVASPIAGWQAGKGGYFLGKGMQSVAAPVARAMQTLAPYAQAVNTLSGAQGVLDLAQMADQTRQDIGTLGISFGKERSQAEKDAHPALINAVVSKIGELSNRLEAQGIRAPEAVAIKLLSDGSGALFGRLMTMYMKAK